MRIVSVGECTIDHYLDLNRQFIGGISLNFAVQCKRAGADAVSLVSRIGADDAPRILQKLAQEGVDASHVQTREGATARQDIIVTDSGERIFPPGGYRLGVLEGFRLSDDDSAFVRRHDVLACALFAQVEPLFEQAIRQLPFDGARVADLLNLADYDYDVGVVARYLPYLAIAFISGKDDMVERLRPLSRESSCLIVVTLGAEGSVALVGGEPHHQPAVPVARAVDTTGCGDAFQAAFTVSYMRNRNVALALRHGAEQAARVIQHYGAID